MKPPTDREMMRLGVDDNLRLVAGEIADYALKNEKLGVHVCPFAHTSSCAIKDSNRLHIRLIGILKNSVRMTIYRDTWLEIGETNITKHNPRTLKRFAEIIMQLRREKDKA